MSFDKHQWPSFDVDEAKKAQEEIDDYNAKMKSSPGDKAAKSLLSAGAEQRDKDRIRIWLTTCIGFMPQVETAIGEEAVNLIADFITEQREIFLPK